MSCWRGSLVHCFMPLSSSLFNQPLGTVFPGWEEILAWIVLEVKLDNYWSPFMTIKRKVFWLYYTFKCPSVACEAWVRHKKWMWNYWLRVMNSLFLECNSYCNPCSWVNLEPEKTPIFHFFIPSFIQEVMGHYFWVFLLHCIFTTSL